MKILVSCVQRNSKYSPARIIWSSLPNTRKVITEDKAHIVLYDELCKAIEDFDKNHGVLRIVVAAKAPKNIPKGLFWIKPDIGVLLYLIHNLNPKK